MRREAKLMEALVPPGPQGLSVPQVALGVETTVSRSAGGAMFRPGDGASPQRL
ncbi:hypothetical protein LNP74_05160 [Klebsiella pneumoniae subsp. pneumoniae]|nr:hypothetical protein [Klebsiella pneumoniae subsp. pneumoniae]